MKDRVRVCKLWDSRLLIHIVRKNTPRFTKSPCLVLIRLGLTEIQRFQKTLKLTKKRMAIWTLCRVVQMAVHFFVNYFNILKSLYLAYYWIYLHQTW